MKPDRDAILRALVFEAFDRRDDHPAFRAACIEAIDVVYLWPLVEYADLLAEARRLLDELRADYWAWTAELANRLDELGIR